MLAAAAFLVILDAVIISSTPNTTRIAFALVVTLLVGFLILRIWRSNTAIEKAKGPGTATRRRSMVSVHREPVRMGALHEGGSA
jgi:hypothetical protein